MAGSILTGFDAVVVTKDMSDEMFDQIRIVLGTIMSTTGCLPQTDQILNALNNIPMFCGSTTSTTPTTTSNTNRGGVGGCPTNGNRVVVGSGSGGGGLTNGMIISAANCNRNGIISTNNANTNTTCNSDGTCSVVRWSCVRIIEGQAFGNCALYDEGTFASFLLGTNPVNTYIIWRLTKNITPKQKQLLQQQQQQLQQQSGVFK